MAPKGCPRRAKELGEGGMDGRDHVEGAAMALGGHVHGEIGGCQILWVVLMGAPFHKEAVGQAPEQAQHRHTVGVADAAAVVVVRNIQSLVQDVRLAFSLFPPQMYSRTTRLPLLVFADRGPGPGIREILRRN